MESEGKVIKLTSAEITSIWTAYMNDSGLICQLQYFLAKAEDEEIRPLIQQALELAQGNVTALT